MINITIIIKLKIVNIIVDDCISIICFLSFAVSELIIR